MENKAPSSPSNRGALSPSIQLTSALSSLMPGKAEAIQVMAQMTLGFVTPGTLGTSVL